VLGEEFGDDGGDMRWIVDPIDGTTSFMRGIPIWGTLLAPEKDGVVELGLASAPALRSRWWATRGGGAERRIELRVDQRPAALRGRVAPLAVRALRNRR